MKKIILLFLVLISLTLNSQQVSKDEAIKAANFLFQEKQLILYNTIEKNIQIKSIEEFKSNTAVLYYIVNYENNGFVLISGNYTTEPLIAYSFESNFNINNSSPGLKDMLNIYEKQLLDIFKNNLQPSQKITDEWNRVSGLFNPQTTKSTNAFVLPLLTTKWNQNIYYNELCPYDTASPTGYDYHVPNGCVALSASQIMYYHRYPETGTGSNSYYHDIYGTLSANFGTTTYDWNCMSDEIKNYNDNAARLIYHVGIAVKMNYEPDGSGAFTEDVPNVLKNYFKYHNTVSMKNKYQYTEANWIALLKQNLYARRPMIYSAVSSSGGHAFNCDGYDDTDKFHFNWGWGGSNDGYFLISNMNPDGEIYNQNHRAVINIYPSTTPVACPSNITLTARTGSLEDGSRSVDYANNLDCRWLIAPENASTITFSFSKLNTEANNDSITFYIGDNTSSPIYQSFSGSSIPSSFNINSNKVLVRFKTNSSTTKDGWLFNYSSAVSTAYCSYIKPLNGASGTFSDGSNSNNYFNNTICKWYITSSSNPTFLTFNNFNLASDDELLVFDRNTTIPILLGTFTGSSLPPTIYCPSNKVLVSFQADNKNSSTGWEANWNSSSSINTIDEVKSIVLTPNPAKEFLNIKFNFENNFNGNINIYNNNGQKVFSKNLVSKNSYFEDIINIDNLSNGLYLLNIQNSLGKQINMKFIKN